MLSLSQSSAGTIDVSGDVSFGNNANGSVTLTIPAVPIPSPPNSAQLFATAYLWTLPAGWAFPDGAISNGTTPQLIRGNSANSIRVTPSAGGAGTVSVQAVSLNCDTNIISSRSSVATTTVTRPLPPLLILSDQTPQGGNISLSCGQQLQNVRPGVGTLPAGGAFGNYSFASSGIVSSSCCLNTAAPVFALTGPGTGTISLQATYSRNGASTTVRAPVVTVQVNPQVATPTAFTAPVIAGGNTFEVCASKQPLFRFAAVAGATGYSWEFPAGFTVVGNPAATSPYVTAAPELQLQAPATFAATEGIVQVRAINANCQPSNPLFVQLLTGSGEGVISSSDYTPSGGTVCPYTSLMLRAITQAARGQNTNFQWSVSGGAQIASGATSSVLELGMPESGSVYVQLSFANSCDGLKTASWYVNVGPRYVNGRLVCSPQSRVAPAPATAYPNPADATLTLEQPAGTALTIYNSRGRAVYQGRAGQQSTRLDTRAWPAGLYLLHSRHGQQTQRQQIQIKH